MMRAAVAMFVFRVPISFCKNIRFLAISFSRIEIACLSTMSASDWLKSFASLVLTVFVDTVGDMLVDLTQSDFSCACDIVDFCDVLCASVPVEHVLRDLELMTVVQHYRNLAAFLASS